MNKKILLSIIIVSILFVSCGQKKVEYGYVGGNKVDMRIINSGYYLDEATLSEIQMGDALNLIYEIEKPNPLGEVEMVDLSSIEITTPKIVEVESKDVEAYIERKRDNAMEYRTIKEKRGAKVGDLVAMDFEGTIKGVPFEGGTGVNQIIIIGEGKYIKGFEEQIIGRKVQTPFNIRVTFPNDYDNEELRGKEAVFNSTIRYIQEPYTPELNSEFFERYSRKKATSAEAYREEVKSDLEFRNKYASEKNIKDQLYEKLKNSTSCTPSELGLAWKVSKLLVTQRRFAKIQGISILEFFKNMGLEGKDIIRRLKFEAMYTIADDMILDELADRYDVKVDNEDLIKWFNDMALYSDYGHEVTYEYYEHSMGEAYIYDNARKDKILSEAIKHIQVIYSEE